MSSDQALAQHHQQLAAEEGAQHFVGLGGQPRHHGLDATRQQVADAVHQNVPVAQQVEGHHRDQQGVGYPAHHYPAGSGHRAHQAGEEPAGLLPVLLQGGAHGLEIQRLVES